MRKNQRERESWRKRKEEREREASGTLSRVPLVPLKRCNVRCARWKPFSRVFFPFSFRHPRHHLHAAPYVKRRSKKTRRFLVGRAFFSVSFFCFCYSTIPSPRTKNQKETHRKGATTTIFWCRHFLAEDNADRENDNERASGVHNILGLVRGGRVSGWEMEERCRVVCRAAAAAKQINGF